MRMTVRYPIHFTAEPPTTDRVKDAICSFAHTADVPELSEGETRLVSRVIFDYVDYMDHDRTITIREYGGALYRRLGKAGDASSLPSFNKAFECTLDRNAPIMPLSDNGISGRPLGIAMWNRIAHRLFVQGGRKKEEYAWPPGPFSQSHGMRWTRNDLKYEDYTRKTGPIDEAMFEACRDEHRAEADKLLVIGGDVYVRTPPMAHIVGSVVNGSYVGVRIEMGFLPEWLDANLERQYFPLGMKAEAAEYAEILHRKLKGDYKSGVAQVSGRELDEALPALSEFDFDHRAYTVNRNIMLLATDVTKVLNEKTELAQLLDAGTAASLAEVSEAALDLGTEIEGWKDVADHADDVISAWRTTGRRPGWSNIPSVRSQLGEMICERTLGLAAEMPISLNVGHGRGFAP